jgi:hypothetical protein
MKLTKLVWHFSVFSMFFDEFCKIFVNIEKEKKDRKGKGLHGFGPAHNEAGPTARIQLGLKKKPIGETHSDMIFCIRNPDLF